MSNLNEYFERARRAEPPLRKDDVSSVLSEKLEQRRQREIAHARTGGLYSHVIPRGLGRFLFIIPQKGWIMFFALLTSSIVAITLMLPQSPPKFLPQTTAALPPAQTPSMPHQIFARTTSPKPRIFTHIAKQNPAVASSIAAVVDSLPAPYDFVELDTDKEPFVDMGDLVKKVIYPEVAKKLGLEGKVNVRALVMPNGSISPRSFVEYSDVKLFDSSALKAVFATSWQPAQRGGKPVPCWVSVPIHFRLNDRVGTNAVKKAQMLELTAEELKKIGVEQDATGIVQVLGWNKVRTKLYRMQVSIHAGIKDNVMGSDSLFKAYLAMLRNNGKHALATEWEQTQLERNKRSIVDLVNDSTIHSNNTIDFVKTKQSKDVPNSLELRAQARQYSFPRLVTDGHNYRYVVDISDAPELVKARNVNREIVEFWERTKSMGLKLQEIQDSLRRINTRYYGDSLYRKIDAEKDSTKIPRLYSDLRVQQELAETRFEQEKSNISTLIGIRVSSTIARSEGDEYLLWYDPTPEFITLLPERYRVEIGREVAAAQKKYATKCDIPTEAEKKAVAGYFDSWRACDGVLKITSIFPNPADIKSTVRFRLTAARKITLTVHGLNGERLAILEPTPLLAAGEHELPLDFTGRNVGVYLLALTTDKGETAIMRVMIVR